MKSGFELVDMMEMRKVSQNYENKGSVLMLTEFCNLAWIFRIRIRSMDPNELLQLYETVLTHVGHRKKCRLCQYKCAPKLEI
jgi:hypothetical protein